MRGKNLVKLLKLLDLLSNPSGTTIKKIGQYLQITKRSVHRLLDLLQSLDFPIYDEKIPGQKEKQWKIEERYLKKLPNIKIPDVDLSSSEIMALYFLKRESTVYNGTEIEKHINSAFAKLCFFVPDTLAKLEKMDSLFISKPKFTKDYSEKNDIIDELTNAMLKNKSCYIEYHSFHDDKTKNFKIDPLHFLENDSGLYLLINTTSFGDIRILAIERIDKITPTDDTFKHPKDFNPEKLLASAFDIVFNDPIDVKIWFSAEQARYIKERTWAPEQTIDDLPDGSIILCMSTSGRWDVKKWVLSYGPHAKVMEPEDLRQEIIKDLQTSYERYQQ